MRKAAACITLAGIALCAPVPMSPQQGLPPTEAMLNVLLVSLSRRAVPKYHW